MDSESLGFVTHIFDRHFKVHDFGTFTIATYALCSFANFGSIAILIGGTGGMEPAIRKDLAKFGLRALAGGALAGFMTAAIAGMLI